MTENTAGKRTTQCSRLSANNAFQVCIHMHLACKTAQLHESVADLCISNVLLTQCSWLQLAVLQDFPQVNIWR